MRRMERVVTDIYSFTDFRNGGFSYVDKTDEMLTMVSGYYIEERTEG